MIEWKVTYSAGGKNRKFWGVSDAFTDNSIVDDFCEQWLKVFVDVVGWYDPERWSSMECGVIAYNGTFDFELLRDDRNALEELPGSGLCFTRLRDYLHGDLPNDETFEQADAESEQKYVGALMRAWDIVKGNSEVQEILQRRPILFRVVNSDEPDTTPLVDTILEP